MNKKITAGLAAVAAGAALVVTVPAFAEGHPPPPEHNHMLLIGVNEAELTYRKCVDLAAGKALRLNAHHDHLHTGQAGQALRGAGHFVLPSERILPPHLQGLGILPANCAGVDAWLEGLRAGG